MIRFNDFADVGYEPHVGHRIHVWCVSCCGNVTPRQWEHPVSVLSIATLAEQPRDVANWLKLYPDMAVPSESWIEMARQLKGTNPTTGLTLLLRLLRHGIRFTAFGFDGLRSGHYWNPLHKHTHWHADEFPCLLKLAAMGAKFE